MNQREIFAQAVEKGTLWGHGTEVWVKRSGNGQEVAFQATRIVQP